MRLFRLLVAITVAYGSQANALGASDPLDALMVYDGDWSVSAEKPWSGATPGTIDHLTSRCRRFTAYVACEQSVNGNPLALIVFTLGDRPGRLNTRTIAPNGLAGSRGDFMIDGEHWTYVDRPPVGSAGPWSRVENFIIDRDHIRFEEYESLDEGATWTRTNAGTEQRVPQGRASSNVSG